MADNTSIAAPASSTPAPASTSAPTTSTSTPTSTSDIAADVIADLESSGDDDNTPPEPAAPAAAAPVVPVTDPDDIDALFDESVDGLGRKRINKIPVPRVKEMRTKSEQKLLANIAKELGMTAADGAAFKAEEIVAAVKDRHTKVTGYEPRLKQMQDVEHLIATDPERFMEIISGINPAYKEYARKEAVAAVVAKPAIDEDPEPQPDYDLGNGQMTYSLKGLKELRAWEHRQAIKEVNAGLEERLGPVEKRLEADRQREEDQQWHTNKLNEINVRLGKARKWPGFTDHEPAMIQAMRDAQQAGSPITMEDAYMQVVVPKLAGERTKIRQEVLAEIEKQPKSSSVTTAPAPKPETTKPKTTADIAREVMASMEA